MPFSGIIESSISRSQMHQQRFTQNPRAHGKGGEPGATHRPGLEFLPRAREYIESFRPNNHRRTLVPGTADAYQNVYTIERPARAPDLAATICKMSCASRFPPSARLTSPVSRGKKKSPRVRRDGRRRRRRVVSFLEKPCDPPGARNVTVDGVDGHLRFRHVVMYDLLFADAARRKRRTTISAKTSSGMLADARVFAYPF